MRDEEISNTDKLEEIYRLTHENHKLLERLNKHNKWVAIGRAIYYVIVISIALGLFYLVQPYIEAVVGAYNQLADGINKVQEVGDKIPQFPDLGDIFK